MGNKHGYLFKFNLIILLIVFTNGIVNAQDELDVIRNNWLKYTDAPNSFYHFLSGEAFKLLESRAKKISEIKTKEELFLWQ
jgi:hypothetical protein